jgi:hypothetical protein
MPLLKIKNLHGGVATNCEGWVSLALPEGQSCLRPGVTISALDRFAQSQSDTESARHMQDAKRLLFLSFQPKRKTA